MTNSRSKAPTWEIKFSLVLLGIASAVILIFQIWKIGYPFQTEYGEGPMAN